MREMRKLASVLKDVALKDMRVSENAQRHLRPHRVSELATNFDPEFFGNPVVNLRGGHQWLIDGQHRIESVKLWLGKDWPQQAVTCRCYVGLTEQEEAAMYLRLNNQLAVGTYDRFKVAVTAGEPAALLIKSAAHKAGVRVGPFPSEGTIAAVATLSKVLARSDAKNLTRSIRLSYECFGDPGLRAPVIDGIARVCERYNSQVKDEDALPVLQNIHGGVGALLTRASNYRKTTGNQLGYCFAAAIVDALNAKAKKKLPSWWKDEK